MATPIHPLQPHACLTTPVRVQARLHSSACQLTLRYEMRDPTAAIRALSGVAARRADELWRHTCLEVFFGLDDGQYLEWNFAPSGEWALYQFSAYRAGMVRPAVPPPPIRTEFAPAQLMLEVQLDRTQWPAPFAHGALAVGLSAVSESVGGEIAYHALAHGGVRPDFHDARTWSVRLDSSE